MFEQKTAIDEYAEIDLQDLEALLAKIDAFMKTAGRDDTSD